MVVFNLYSPFGPPLSYFMGRNLDIRKKLTPVRIMISVGTNIIGIIDDNNAMNNIFRK